jgi:hypothetical protein
MSPEIRIEIMCTYEMHRLGLDIDISDVMSIPGSQAFFSEFNRGIER